jgi:hypothetical protein
LLFCLAPPGTAWRVIAAAFRVICSLSALLNHRLAAFSEVRAAF